MVATLWKALLALETFHVLFLLLHDWVPVPPLNDVAAQREADSFGKRLISTLLSTLPFVALLWGTLTVVRQGGTSGVLLFWLWFGYTFLFLGELNAWWFPYLVRPPKPELAARYAQMFDRTHAFLPERNGIRPNTMHVILHTATAVTLVLLLAVTLSA